MATFKILSSYHKKAAILDVESIIPFWTSRGNEFAGKILLEDDRVFLEANTLHGDIGDNISQYAHIYNETVAFYWAWKNMDKLENPDYIGFFHYRRHFDFSDNTIKNKETVCIFPKIDNSYLELCGLNYNNIQKVLSEYDLILPKPYTFNESIQENFEIHHGKEEFLNNHSNLLDLYLDIVVEMYPKFRPIVKSFLKNKTMFLCNMFIMKKDLFVDYAEWLFSILQEGEKRINLTALTPFKTIRSARMIGFISERLNSIYMQYLSSNKSLKIKQLPITYIEDTLLNVDNNAILPAFKENNIPICFSYSGDKKYLRLMLVALKSLIINTSENNNYDILIFYEQYDDSFKKFLNSIFVDMIGSKTNIKIRLINILSHIDSSDIIEINKIKNNNYYKNNFMKLFGINSFFRLLLPFILKNTYEKCIYLDIDILIKKDIADLYNIDLKGKSIAMSRELCLEYMLVFNKPFKNWFIENQGLNSSYYNAGIAVMDIKKLSQNNNFINPLTVIDNFINGQFIWGDQDYLNFYLKDDIYDIGISWNFSNFILWVPVEYLSFNDLNLYREASSSPYIIHFLGDRAKPWSNLLSGTTSAYEWFKVAKLIEFSFPDTKNPINGREIVDAIKFSVKKTIGKDTFLAKILNKTYKFTIGKFLRK